MGAAATFYIDNPSFEKATTVFSDAALTTCAPNGFYQMGGIVREQVDCVAGLGGRLLPAEDCPSCGAPPTTAPPLPTPAPQTTPPITQPPPDPLYYKLISCPTTSSGGGGTLKYTDITPSTSSANQRYQDSTQDPAIFYTYDGSAGISNPPPNTIDRNIQIVPGVFNCPTLLPVYNFYNAILCNNVDSIIVRSPEGTTFVAGQVVKVIGSTLCYEIRTIAAQTSIYRDYDTSIPPYPNCEACDPTPLEPNGFRITKPGAPDNEVLQDTNNPRSQGERILTSFDLQDCWTLQEPIITVTANFIRDDCPPDLQCTLTILYGGPSGGTFSATECNGTPLNTIALSPNEERSLCFQTGTLVTTGITQDDQGACDPSAIVDPYDYYNLKRCDGVSGVLIAKYNGAQINNGQSVKIAGICYYVDSPSTSKFTMSIIDGTQIFDNCSECNPCVGVTQLILSYDPNSSCLTTNSSAVLANNTTLATATFIYPAGATSCTTSNPAPVGFYTGGGISRYWNGLAFTQTINCTSTPQTVTATLTRVDNQIQGPSAGYTLGGDQVNDAVDAPYGSSTAFSFNTTVTVNNGFTFTTPYNVTNFSGTLNTQDLTGTTVITGEVVQDAPTYFYQIQQCGTGQIYNMEAPYTINSNTVVFARLKGVGFVTFCGTVLGTAPSSAQITADFVHIITSSGCNNRVCTGNYNYDPF